jgi:beta-1,4-mannosyltransferase
VTKLRVLSFPADLGQMSNPYVSMIADELIARGVDLKPYRPFRPFQNADVLHIHWLERVYQMRIAQRHPVLSFLAFCILYLNIVWIKGRGGRVIWTAHNLRPHDGVNGRHAAVWRFWSPRIYTKVDAVLCMTESAIGQVRTAIPELAGAQFYVAPHPHYRGVYAGHPSGEGLRERLGIPPQTVVLGMIGYMRPYKGILQVALALERVKDSDVRLLVAGRCQDEPYLKTLQDLALSDPRLLVLEGSLSNPQFAEHVDACTLCVFNFSDILNSGSVVAALSLDRPVLAPGKGAVSDLAELVGAKWLQTFAGGMSASVLESAVGWARAGKPDSRPDLSALDPSAVAATHLSAYCGEAQLQWRSSDALAREAATRA